MPRFSVVIPVYNRAGQISPTLGSVRDQSFGDFECLVIDDGSQDGERVRLIVESLGDPRFRYYRRENGGASAARNTGIEKSTGEFIAFLDSDDRWLASKLESDNRMLKNDCGVSFSQIMVERQGALRGARPSRGPYADEDISEYLACHQGFTPVSTLVVPAALARRVTFDEQVRFGDDTDFAIRLAAAGAEFKMHAEPLAVMNDSENVGRLSQETDWKAVSTWLERIRPLMTPKAYRAYRGWHVSRLAATSGRYDLALSFYFQALAHGAFPCQLAMKAFLQILVPRPLYRRLQAALAWYFDPSAPSQRR